MTLFTDAQTQAGIIRTDLGNVESALAALATDLGDSAPASLATLQTAVTALHTDLGAMAGVMASHVGTDAAGIGATPLDGGQGKT